MGNFRGSSVIDKASTTFVWGTRGDILYNGPVQIVFPTIKKRWYGDGATDSNIVEVYEHQIGNGYPGDSTSGLWNLFQSQNYDINAVLSWAQTQASLWVSYIKTKSGFTNKSNCYLLFDEERNDLIFPAKPGNNIPSGFLSLGATYFDTAARADSNYLKNVPATEPGRTLQIANDYEGCMSGIWTSLLNQIHTELPNIKFGRYGNIPSVAWRDYILPATTSLIRDASYYYGHPCVTHGVVSTYWEYVLTQSSPDNPFSPAYTLTDTHFRIYYGAAISGMKTIGNYFNKQTLCYQRSNSSIQPSSLQPEVASIFMDLYNQYQINALVFWMAPNLPTTGFLSETQGLYRWKNAIESIIATTGVSSGGGGGIS